MAISSFIHLMDVCYGPTGAGYRELNLHDPRSEVAYSEFETGHLETGHPVQPGWWKKGEDIF